MNKNQSGQSKSAESSLLTSERSQKLDLLIHLISNLKQTIVICGPNGIGKTVILNELKKHKIDDWSVLTILGSSNLSYERIQDQLSWFLEQDNIEYQNLDLTAILSALNQQKQKIVVLIDDAGLLVPGLISSLVQLASENSCLRIVFSLTHEEIEIKNISDQLIEECHFIEIPALTEKQCGIFLQNMSFQPDSIIVYDAINDDLIEKLHRETLGIPGKIITELPKLATYSSGINVKKIVALVLVLAFGISVFLADKYRIKENLEPEKKALVFQQAESETTSLPEIHPIGDKLNNEMLKEDSFLVIDLVENSEVNKSPVDVVEQTTVKADLQQQEELKQNPEIQQNEAKNEAAGEVDIKTVPQTEKAPIIEESVDSSTVADKIQLADKKIVNVDDKQNQSSLEKKVEEDDSQWILDQPEKSLTIQLVVLSKRESVLDFLKNNRKLEQNIKFFQQDKQKYIVIYGAFKNNASASKNMKLLPLKFRKSWIRKFRELHKIINIEP